MGLKLLVQRLRHSRGFGIHSPYAFRFVTEVLNQPCSYYAYNSLPEDVLSRHDWQLLVRLLVHFRPRRIALDDGMPSQVGRFVRRVCPRVQFSGNPDLLICIGGLPEKWRMAVCEGELHAIVLNSKSMPSVVERAHGMAFGNGRCWIMAAFNHLPAQNFDVQF